MKKLYSVPRGGLYLPSSKDHLKNLPIQNASLPPMAILPLIHDGNEATSLVNVGDVVQEGMVIGKVKGKPKIYIHSSIPGVVRDIRKIPVLRKRDALAVCIELGGGFERLGKKESVYPWSGLSQRELKSLLLEKGIVDRLLNLDSQIELLIVNGLETEPFICSNYRLLVEKPSEIIEGIQVIEKLLNPKRTTLVIEKNNPAIQKLYLDSFAGKETARDLTFSGGKYPAGDVEQIIKVFSNHRMSFGKPTHESAIAVIDIATVYSVYEGAVLRKPFMERVVTIGGKAIRKSANLKVRIGTPILDLIEECGGLSSPPVKVVIGGPFRGYGIFDLRTPITKETSGVLFLTADEIHQKPRTPCINCGRCITACPEGLHPSKLFKWIDHGYFHEAGEDSLMECSECGCCAFVCPSRIPLVQSIQAGKVMLLKGIHHETKE